MNALILVDLQNDFVPGGALPVPQGDQVVVTCNELQKRFDQVVATQDWHPPDHGSFAANHPGFTALDARQLGCGTHIVVDACRGVNLKTGDVDRAIEEMHRAGVGVSNSGEIPHPFERLATLTRPPLPTQRHYARST